MRAENLLARLMRDTLKDIKVELDDEFQQNFRREEFFNEKWQRRKYDDGSNRKLLQGQGKSGVHLSQISASGRIEEDKVVYWSTLPYAAIHNQGGTIRVTAKMKRYFWAKYFEAAGSFTYKKDGQQRSTQRQRKLSADSGFYKAMALKKVGDKIKIPRRQFIGRHPSLEAAMTKIIEKNLDEFLKTEFPNLIQSKEMQKK